MSICWLVCLSVHWSVGPLVGIAFVLAGREKPANDLFRVYKLVYHDENNAAIQKVF